MILKKKNNDVALRSLSEIFDDIQAQIQKGCSGLIFSSSYTLNIHVKLISLRGNIDLIDVLRRFSTNVITLFLLPPPTMFSDGYRSMHANNALELIKTGVLVWFDRAVHSKFLLFWSFNQGHLTRHRKYYGSTNFTQGGLIKNIEEFYHNKKDWGYTTSLNSHLFYLNTALKHIEEIAMLYESPDYLSKKLDDFQTEIQENLDKLNKSVSAAKGLIEKLKTSIFSYSCILDRLCDLWNFPGKQFAYNTCEKLLLTVDDYSSFNLEFLEELITWPNETFYEFIKRWEIDIERYFEVPSKVIQSISILGEEIQEYRKNGYEAYIYDEERELIEHLRSTQTRETLSILKELAQVKK